MSVTVVPQMFISSMTEITNADKSATIYHIIKCTAVPRHIRDLESAPGLPVVGDPYDEYDNRYCSRVNIKGMGNKLEYVATIDYKTLDAQDSGEPNPVLRKDDIDFEGSKEQEDCFTTVDSPTPKHIVTSAGEAFKKDPARTTGSFKLTITGNRTVGTISPATVASYLRPNSVNDGSMTIRGISIGTGEAKLVGAGYTIETDQVYGPYEKWKWELELAPDWQLHLEDRGFGELVDDGTDSDDDSEASLILVPIVKGDPAMKVETPWPLDGSGSAKNFADDAPAVLDFNIYPKKDFSVFDWTTTA